MMPIVDCNTVRNRLSTAAEVSVVDGRSVLSRREMSSSTDFMKDSKASLDAGTRDKLIVILDLDAILAPSSFLRSIVGSTQISFR